MTINELNNIMQIAEEESIFVLGSKVITLDKLSEILYAECINKTNEINVKGIKK